MMSSFRFVLLGLLLALSVELSVAQKGCSLTIKGKKSVYAGCQQLATLPVDTAGPPVPIVYYRISDPENVTFALSVDISKYAPTSLTGIALGFGSVMDYSRVAALYYSGDAGDYVLEEWALGTTQQYKKSYPYVKNVLTKSPVLGLQLVEYEMTKNGWAVEFTISNRTVLQEGANPFIWAMFATFSFYEDQMAPYHPNRGTGSMVITGLTSTPSSNSSMAPAPSSQPTPTAPQCVMNSKVYQGCQNLAVGFDMFWSTNGTDRLNIGLQSKAAAYAGVGFGSMMPGTYSPIIYALSDGTVGADDFFLKDRAASQIFPSTAEGLDFLTIDRTSAGEFILEFSRPLEIGNLPSIVSGFNDIIWAFHDELSDSVSTFVPHSVSERGTTKINIDLSAGTPPSAPPPTPAASSDATPTASVPGATPVVGSATPVAPSPSGPIETPTTGGCLLQYRGRQVPYETCKNLAPGFDIYFAANGTDRVLIGLKAKTDGYASIGFGPPPVTNAIVIYALTNTTIGAGDFAVRGLQPGDVVLDGSQMLDFLTVERTGAGYLVLEVTRPLSPGSGIPIVGVARTTITWAIDNHAISNITEINPRRATSRGQTVVDVPGISGSESPASSPAEPTPVPALPSVSGIPEASTEPTPIPACFLTVAGQERGFDGCTTIVTEFDVFYKLNGSRINLAMKVKADGYAGLGFGSGMVGSHSAIVYHLDNSTLGANSFRFDDRVASSIFVDNSQDLEFLSFERTSDGYFVSEFTRPLEVSGLPSVNVSGDNFIIYARADSLSPSITEFIPHGFTLQDRGATVLTFQVQQGIGASVEPTLGSSGAPASTDLGPSPLPNDGSACFPGDAVVELVNGEKIRMQDLALGDQVRTSSGSFSPVFFMTHRIHPSESDRLFDFIEISVEDPFSSPAATRVLELSPNHYLPSSGALVSASEIQVGDRVTIVSGQNSRPAIVTQTRRVTKAGLYNPHTIAGDMVVNSFAVSCYTRSVHPKMAHYLLLPLRAAFQLFKTPLTSLSSTFDRPQSWMPRFVPSGPTTLL